VSSGAEAAFAEHGLGAKAAPRTARESWKAARTLGRPGEGRDRRIAPPPMDVREIDARGHGPNVEVNQRAQRVWLNLVLGLRGVCGAFECAASDWRAMECPNPEFQSGDVCGTGDGNWSSRLRGAAERRQNAQPCATLAALVSAQDAGRRRTFVSSGVEAARAEHE